MNDPLKLLAATGFRVCVIALLGTLLAGALNQSARAQGQLASGTVIGSGTGPYTYSLTFSDAAGATSPIGSVWYAWVPGSDFLPGSPTSESTPTGWTATVASGTPGYSIQFKASSSAYYIPAGGSLSGFGYQAGFSPAQLAATANSGESVAYSAALFSDPGYTFTVLGVPEPSTTLLLLIPGLLWLAGRARCSSSLSSHR